MANVHAAIKQVRKDARRALGNQAVRSELKTLWSKLSKLSSPDQEKAKGLACKLTSKWDRAVASGMVPKGRADRKKARIAHFLTRLGSNK